MRQLTAFVVVACLASGAGAATINLNMDSLDLMYNGMAGLIHDINSESNADGGNSDPNEANPLDATTFTLDDTVVAQFMASDAIYADLLIKNLPDEIEAPDINSIPDPGPVTFAIGENNFSFGFEWFLDNGGATESSLTLDFDKAVVILTDTGSGPPTFTISASTTQWSSFNLPDELQFLPGTELAFSYTAQNTAVAPTEDDAYTVVFGMKGVASISGAAIPEPSAGYLLLASLASTAVAVRWRLG